MTTDVVAKLWGFCHTLRHDGIGYSHYVEQLTYLLFLKMASEREIGLPKNTDWAHLRALSGTDLLDAYVEALRLLGKQPGILGDIFGGAQSRFSNPVNLKKLIGLIDETDWTSLDVDVKAAAFEGLIEKAASEGKKGAGQYFTPRLLIKSIVRLMKPDPRSTRDFKIDDPGCGTGGFLVASYEWLLEQSKGSLERDVARRIRTQTYFGQDIDPEPRRLAVMNLYLHQVEPHIERKDSIYETPGAQRFDVVLTNPPFGTKGANQAPERDDFTVATSNKQLNFIQHVLTIMKPGGRAAVVVPDNVLFVEQAADVFKVLMEDCDLHTVLRLPRGTFSPYSEGTNTNVIFFTKGRPTSTTWIFDARANVPKITKKERPLSVAHFDEFEKCFGSDPNGRSRRTQSDSPEGRWREFSAKEIRARDYKLDSFKWIRDLEADDPRNAPDPNELIGAATSALRDALADLEAVERFLKASEVASRQNGDLPKGWHRSTLGEVAKVVGGGTPRTTEAGNFSEESGHPWITPADLTGYTDKYISRGRRFLTDQGLAESSAKFLPTGSVLFSSRAPIGYVAIAANPVTTNQGFRSFVPSDKIDSNYLYYVLRFLKPLAEERASGTTFMELSGSNAAKLPIAFPVLSEQRAIAEALERIERSGKDAATHLALAQQSVERTSWAVLAKVFRTIVGEEDGKT